MEKDLKEIFTESDGKLTVIGRISSDRMKLFIDVERYEGATSIARGDLLELLERHASRDRFNEGVIDDIVQALNRGEKKIESRRIAVGTAPEKGLDGRLVLLRKKFGDPSIRADEKGTVDLTQLNLFENILKGEVIGRLYPPKVGVPGHDALGRALPARSGVPLRPRFDKSIVLRQSGDPTKHYEELVAQEDGLLAEEDNKLLIRPELVIDGDLDFRYGSLDFVGSVKVLGDVQPGFHITARKGITIDGGVRLATLQCTDGDIVVKGFLYGGQGTRIVCGKSLRALIVQGVNAEVLGEIVIGREARDSRLRTQTTLRVEGGAIIGGECDAVCGVEAKVVGSDAGVKTVINLCSTVEASFAFGKLLVSIENHDRVSELLKLHLGPYADRPTRIELLKEPLRTKMRLLRGKLDEVTRSRAILLGDKKKMLEAARRSTVSRVTFHDRMYEGVEVRGGEKTFAPTKDLAGPQSIEYLPETDALNLGEAKPLECSFKEKDKEDGNR